MMDAGHIDIAIRDRRVSLVSTRAKAIGTLFRNRDVNFVASTIPRLFAVCGQAQSLASRYALALAQGEAVEPDIDVGVIAEAIREHLMRIAVDWRKALGDPAAEVTELRTIFGLPKLAASSSRDELAATAAHLLTALAAPTAEILQGLDALTAGDTVAARLLQLVQSRGWSSLGQCTTDDETTAFSLCSDEPAVAAVRAEHGEGLLARLYARLVHTSLLVEVLTERRLQAGLQQGVGWGAASLPTSRGTLLHHAGTKDGLVSTYEIVAPTDINFVPDGPAARALQNLVRQAKDDVELPARLLIEAFDPCTSYSLRLH